MLKEKKLRQRFKNGFLYSIGLSATLFTLAYTSFNLKFGDSSFGEFVYYIVHYGVTAFFAMPAFFITLLLFGIEGGIVGQIILSSTLNDYENESIKEGKKIYTKLNPKILYSKEEIEERDNFSVFFKLLLKSSILDLTKLDTENKIDRIKCNVSDSKIIKNYYIDNYVNQNSHILSNLFIHTLSLDLRYPHINTGSSIPDGYIFFTKLIELNAQFTQSDQHLITQFLKEQTRDNVERVNKTMISFMSKEQNFKLFNEENKHLFLQLFENYVENRNELIKLTQLNENKHHDKDIPHSLVAINTISYENFNEFKENCTTLYQNNVLFTQLMDKVEKVLLSKEQILNFLKYNQDNSLEYFLSQDIDKFINQFNQEINILHQMNIMAHPELEKNKQLVLISISTRMDIVVEKLNQHVSTIHQKLTDNLELTKEINNKVMQAKIKN